MKTIGEYIAGLPQDRQERIAESAEIEINKIKQQQARQEMKNATLFTKIDDYLYNWFGITIYAYEPWKVWTTIGVIAMAGLGLIMCAI